MDYQTIIAAPPAEGVGIITLNRPDKRNALSIRMRWELSACLEAWTTDPAVGAVVITGEGEAFCAGFDLQEFRTPALFDELLESSSVYHRDLWGFPKPVIAAVNGAAMGGGFDLACLCDIRICDEGAVFAHPEVKFGAPPLVTPLRWIVGEGRAREICFTGRRIPAQEALAFGLVSEVTPSGGVRERGVSIARSTMEAPRETLRFLKKVFVEGRGDFEECLVAEHDEAFREVLFPAIRREI